MASPLPPTPTQTILSCADSPLSTTASVVGILTFALGLLASYIALQSATRGAPSEIARLVDDLRSTQHEINRVAEYIFDEGHRHHVLPGEGLRVTGRFVGDASPRYVIHDDRGAGAGGAGIKGLYEEVQALLGNCVRLFYEADDLLKKSRSESGRWDPEGLRRRVVFVMNRHEVAEKMVRLGDQKKKLADVQMGLFMRKNAVQDVMLKQIAESVKELQRQNSNKSQTSDDSDMVAPDRTEY